MLLRGVVDQLLFGERPDPLGAASEVAGRIGADPVVALRAIREALVIPYAAVLVDGVPLASSGSETTHTRTLDLDGAGELVVGLRPGDLSFSPGDEQVLRLTVPLLAQTLRARALAEDLIESRGQTIAAVAEERRRLRRELHDGLGPRLSGVAFTSDAARNLIRTDPAAAEAMVAQLRADTVIAIEEIRRMVYAMRPPALDELGLVPALRQQAVGLRNRDGDPVAVDVTAPEEFPDLPAAVEVAAYRIVTEALTNVARHSTSASASVRLDPAADGLHLEVTDRGPQRRVAGRRRARLDARAGHRAGRDPRGGARSGRWPGGGTAAALNAPAPTGYRSGSRGEWEQSNVEHCRHDHRHRGRRSRDRRRGGPAVARPAAGSAVLVRPTSCARRRRHSPPTWISRSEKPLRSRPPLTRPARTPSSPRPGPPRRSASCCRPTRSGRTRSARPTGSTRRSTTRTRTTSRATCRPRASVPSPVWP